MDRIGRGIGMAEHVEQRGDRWFVRYKDNPDDPWSREGPFPSRQDAENWLADNPAVEVSDDQD